MLGRDKTRPEPASNGGSVTKGQFHGPGIRIFVPK